ncbi:MAG: glycosyltransferase [Verrucomicrobiaceae bacterium]|nr:MAG: glycosyltransferase [Verrucomicrobiaceae bacterium]
MRPRFYWWPRLAQGFLIARKAQLMTAVSPYTAEVWTRDMGRKKPIHVVPNGLPDAVLREGASMRPAAKQKELVLGAIGDGFTTRKNTEGLLRAFRLVRMEVPKARLLIFGTDHGLGQAAERWAVAEGLSDGVEFRGRTPHQEIMRELRESIDVYVHPSLEESCCMAVLEAMASGLPVVGGDKSGGVPWQLEGGAGIVCDVLNPTAFATAILAGWGRQDLADAARSKVLSSFTTEAVSQRYLDLLEEARC